MTLEQMALWALLAVAVMLGTVYAMLTPSKVDAMLGFNPKVSKAVSAIGCGGFLALFLSKQFRLDIPSIELAAIAFLLAAAGPPTLSLIVLLLPDEVVKRVFGRSNDK